MKLDFLTKQRMTEAGEKERYCITELFTSLNATSTKYTFELFNSRANIPVCYDGLVAVRCKKTENILRWFLIEAKVRKQSWPDYFLEKTKYKKLVKAKNKFKHMMFLHKQMDILYVNFTPENTLIFDLEKMEENGELGEAKKEKMNTVTVANNKKKSYKQAYRLLPEYASIKDWSYEPKEHHKELVNKKEEIDEEISGIYNWLFGQKAEEKIKKYREENKLPKT